MSYFVFREPIDNIQLALIALLIISVADIKLADGH